MGHVPNQEMKESAFTTGRKCWMDAGEITSSCTTYVYLNSLKMKFTKTSVIEHNIGGILFQKL